MTGLTCTNHQLEDLSGPLVQDLEVMSLNKVVQMHDTVNARGWSRSHIYTFRIPKKKHVV